MTATAFLSVSPRVEGSMAPEIAKAVDALEEFDIEYETTPMGTILEASEVGELFAAAEAAHEAVDGHRVGTFLKIDDKRTVEEAAERKVEKVEEHLGREAKSQGGRNQ
ncbi:thiamine-binding protein [Halovenus sp. HT40]|uniref:thiamine-binding protein n=1 Tax=Halovenus sp. HT40 TaxID=3126691 RepID=UPI00300F5657